MRPLFFSPQKTKSAFRRISLRRYYQEIPRLTMKKKLSSFALFLSAAALAIVGRAASSGPMGVFERGAFERSPQVVATKAIEADAVGDGYSVSGGVFHVLNADGWAKLAELGSQEFADVTSIEIDADTIVVSESLGINLNLPLDGKGHMVAFEKLGYQLFDSIGVAGSVANLRISSISKSNVGVVAALRSVGGIVAGVNYGKITDCYVRGTLQVDLKAACYGLDPNKRRVAMGGVVGENYGEISRCHFNTGIYMESPSDTETDGYIYPSDGVFISCMVGYNAGSMTDCFFNAAMANGNAMRGDVFSGSNFVLTIRDATTTEKPICRYALCVAMDGGGTVSRLYCPQGTFDALLRESKVAYVGVPTVSVMNDKEGIVLYASEVEDEMEMLTELDSRVPSWNDLQFADNSAWGFDYSFYNMDTASHVSINYRAPEPLMGAEPSFGGLAVADGVVNVGNREQWNHLSDALEHGIVKTVNLTADIDGTLNARLFPVRNFSDVTFGGDGPTLEGNGHTVSFEAASSAALFDAVGYNSTVRNLRVRGEASSVTEPVDGLLARENFGTIESVCVMGSLSSAFVESFANIDSKESEVVLGGIVGANYGTISNAYSNARVSLRCDARGTVCPWWVYVGGLAGRNSDTMKNCVLDVVVDDVSEYGGTVVGQGLGFAVSSSYGAEVYVADTTFFGETIQNAIGLAVGIDYGTLTNIYCSKGTFSTSGNYRYKAGVSLEKFIVNGDDEATAKIVAPLEWADDAAVMQEIGREWPIAADLKTLFGDDAAKWTFNVSDYARAQNSGYSRRSPIPTMGQGVEFDYAKSLNIVDGVSIVRDSAQWDATCHAIADGVAIDGIEIARDFAMSDNQQTIVQLDGTLNGGKHKIDNVSRPLVENIGETGSVRNLAIYGNLVTVNAPTFGMLACVNAGSVDGVLANVSLYVGLEDVMNASVWAEDSASVGKVAIGGLVGRNSGAITSTHVSASIDGMENEGDTIMVGGGTLSSFHIAGVAGHNSGVVKDCYVGNVVGGQERSWLISLYGTVMQFVSDTASQANVALGAGYLVGGNTGDAPSTVLCAPGMAESEPEGVNLSFESRSSLNMEVMQKHSLKDSWNGGGMTDLEVEVSDTLYGWWAVDANLYLFDDPAKWTFNVGAQRSMEYGGFRYPVPSMIERVVDVDADKNTRNILVAVSDSSSLKGFFEVVGDANTGFYRDALITFLSDVAYSPFYPQLDTLTAGNVHEVLDSLPSIPRFNGTLNGSNVDNLAFQTGGVIDTLDAGGNVNGLVLNNTLFYVDPTNPNYLRSNDTIYVHLLVGLNNGRMNNVGVSGCVVVDDRNLSALGDTTIVIVLVGEDSGLGMSGYIFLDDPQTPGSNKRFIPIKQNLCTGRNRPQGKNKVAMRKVDGTKSLMFDVDLNSLRFKQEHCLFSDEEFGNGLVAYWLNFSGEGFTGEYTGAWTQGDRVPVSAKNKRTALYKVDIELQGDSALTSAPLFANGGSVVTLRHSKRPLSITMGGSVVPVQSDTLTSFEYVGGAKIVLKFGTTALEQADIVPFGVAVDGSVVRFVGGEGETKTLYNLAGVKVVETTAGEVRLSQKGIFIVRCGKWTQKLTVK